MARILTDRRSRFWLGVVALAVASLAIPAISRTVEQALPRPEPRRDVTGALLTPPAGPSTLGYRVRPYLRLPWGDAPRQVAVWESIEIHGLASISAYGVSDDGAVWIIDYPSRFRRARAQRFSADGKLMAERALDAASSGFSFIQTGDLFYVVSSSGGRGELVRRIDSRGRPGVTYGVPAGLNLTGVAMSPDGAVFGRTEVWQPMRTSGASVLVPRLTRIGDLTRSAAGKVAELAGHSFTGSGELAVPEHTVPFGGASITRRIVRYYETPERVSRAYTLDEGLEWVGGDGDRFVYAELTRPADHLTAAQRALGESGDQTRRVARYDRNGEAVSTIQLPWDPTVSSVQQPIRVDSRGRVFIAGADRRGFVLWVAEPEDGRRPPTEVSPAAKPADTAVEFWAGQEPASFDPFATDKPSQLAIMHLAYSGLVRRNASGGLLPDLAREVPSLTNGGISRDGLWLRYRLRPGARFADGRPVGAADVAATWRFARSRASWDKTPPRWLRIVRGVRAQGTDTIIVRLTRPAAWAVEEVVPFVLPAEEVTGDAYDLPLFQQPTGSGPYRLVEWRRGDRMRFEAVPGYHLGNPKVPTLVVRFSKDASKAAEFLAADKPVVWEWVGGLDEDRIERGRPGALRRTWADFWWGYAFNMRLPLFQDVRIRRALAAGYPRTEIDSRYLRPLPRGVAARPVRPDSWAYEPHPAGPVESTRTTVQLLRATGWRMGTDRILHRGREKFTINVGGTIRAPYTVNELLQNAYDAIRETWMPLGVWPSTAMSDPRFYDRYDAGGTAATGRFHIAYMAFPAGVDPTKDWAFRSDDIPTFDHPDGRNVAGVRDPTMDGLLADAERPAPQEVRARRIRQLLEYLERQVYVIVERPGEKLTAVSRVKNVRPSDGGWGDLWNVHEWEIEPAAER